MKTSNLSNFPTTDIVYLLLYVQKICRKIKLSLCVIVAVAAVANAVALGLTSSDFLTSHWLLTFRALNLSE
jgi:hypothetical protein